MYKSPYKIYWTISGISFFVSVVFLWWGFSKIGLHFDDLKIHSLALYFLAINFTVGFLYLYDKIIAGAKITRVPEIILQTLALLGGSPTALVSQKLFHHKTSKKSFQIVYWLIVLAQAGVVLTIIHNNFSKIK